MRVQVPPPAPMFSYRDAARTEYTWLPVGSEKCEVRLDQPLPKSKPIEIARAGTASPAESNRKTIPSWTTICARCPLLYGSALQYFSRSLRQVRNIFMIMKRYHRYQFGVVENRGFSRRPAPPLKQVRFSRNDSWFMAKRVKFDFRHLAQVVVKTDRP